ncbi:MAG: tRNA (adenosine(37)-N6)-threonylcarbamoyltransferase complex ATPase subunit type 1 TsaE [Clostridia bacterium]|nr:tRNA (adenosine(37)-N6)-threonylcarbamoyltransferase complex ATPase subunit type 1 TsaE [Clostridia bacterium]
MKEIISRSPGETEDAGRALAEAVKAAAKKEYVALYGELGAGKTAFVRGFVSVLSPGSRVKSPTYTIVNEYRRGEVPVFHFDFYRTGSEEDFIALGFCEYIDSGICISEWSELIPGEIFETIPDPVTVRIDKISESERKISIDGADIDL